MSGKDGANVNGGGEQAGKEGGSEELSFLYALATTPCFRQSTLLGIGGGGAIGAMQLMRSKDVMQSAESMVKTGCGIALLTWIVCRKRYYDEREATYGALEKMKKKQAAFAAARAKKMREGMKEKERDG